MSVRVTPVGGLLVDGTGAPLVNTIVTYTILPPATGVALLDTSNETVSSLPLTTVTDNTGAFTKSVIAPGDITPPGSVWQVSYLNTILTSPSFAYSASNIDPSSWAPAVVTSGMIRMYLTEVLGNAAPEIGDGLALTISQNAEWTGGSGANQTVSPFQPIALTLNSSGTIYSYLIPSTQLTPSTTYYNLVLPNGFVKTFTCPTTYTGTDDYLGAMLDRGAYAGGTTYAINDVVEVGGVPYYSIQNANTGHTPASSPTWWTLYGGVNINRHLSVPTPAGQSPATTAMIPHDATVEVLPDDTVQTPATLSDDLTILDDRTSFNTRKITTNSTMLITDDYVEIDATSGNITYTLLAATARQRPIYFKRLDNSGNTVTIARVGSDTIDGATSKVIATQYGSLALKSNVLTTWDIYGTGSGTVTNVTVPTGLTSSGSGTATIAITEDTQAANKIKAGPASGSAAIPTYRTLVPLDIPTAWGVTAKTANYTITAADSGILGDATGGVFTITLPTAVGATQDYAIKKKDSSANKVTVGTTSSQNIDTATTYDLTTQGMGIVVRSNNVSWYIVATVGVGGGGGSLEVTDGTTDLTGVTKITVSNMTVGGTAGASTLTPKTSTTSVLGINKPDGTSIKVAAGVYSTDITKDPAYAVGLLLMQNGVTFPPVPLTTEDGTDWLYYG